MQAQSTYARELYAITSAVAKFRHYLFGHQFIIRTDHASLKHLMGQAMQTPEQEACLPKLLGYQFSIEYKPGKHNQAADALSRLSCMSLTTIVDPFMEYVYKEVRGSPYIQALKQKVLATPSDFAGFTVKHGDLVWKDRLVLPHDNAALIQRVLWEYHSSMISGHAGFLRTFHRIAAMVFLAVYAT